MSLPAQLGLVYFVSEIVLRFSRRSSGNAQKSDGGSLLLLWLTIGAGVGLGITLTHLAPSGRFFPSQYFRTLAVLVFAAALGLRWWSILSLGKFFTVDVAIAHDHQLVIRGPYRWMRHPSYTGMMVAFLALGLTLENWISLLALLVPIALALAYRIKIEERALLSAFGDEYRRYASTTKRLIPGVL
ncbi:MAG: putative Isoprenylcysteine carboxyl methyltransferase [Verrucomicrobia bacterium]|nr:putative Isoprenylcysteine carboxyl methyltransferase [Verrucomicrobiota bacterium]